jgi:hypothetical protein
MPYVSGSGPLWYRSLLAGLVCILVAVITVVRAIGGGLISVVVGVGFGTFGIAGIVYGLYLLKTNPRRHDWPGGPGAKTR